MLTDIQENGKWLMHIGLKYQSMKSMIMIIRELFPIIGFSMRGDSAQWTKLRYQAGISA